MEQLCPPLGAAVLGLQCRSDDTRTIGLLAPLDHARTRREVTAERVLLRVLRGRGSAPVAGHCTMRPDGRLSLRGTVFAADGSWFLHTHLHGSNVLAVDGQRALDRLGQDIGPVLASTYTGTWTFFIERHAAQGWDLHGVRVLCEGTIIALPLRDTQADGRDIRWIVPPGEFTDPALLYQALSGRTAVLPPSTGRPRRASRKSTAAGARPGADGVSASTPRGSPRARQATVGA
ncbi:hypothetical protein ABZ769_15630 [Streptomyces olivoreticuli]